MKPRQIVVNILLLAAFAGLGVYCYNEGKAYDILIDNAAFTHEGTTYEAYEAILVTVDGEGEPLYLVEGDRGAATIAGKKHVLLVEELDIDDNVVKSHKLSFKNKELKGNVVNVVPLANGKLPGWSYPLK